MNPNKENLGNAPKARVTESNRIPMSAPNQKLSVPEIPGFHLHWHLGKNVARAKAAGYSHVTLDDGVFVDNSGLADPKSTTGSTDLGSNISILAGDSADENGDPERLYLMKLPQEWWEKDQKVILERNESIAQQLRGGGGAAQDESAADRGKRYMKKGQDLFTPKH